MSWSVYKKVGTVEKMKAYCETQFDQAAKSYAGQPEGDDVIAAKASVMTWLNALSADQIVMVEANGSRGGNWLSLKIQCDKLDMLT